MNREQIRRFILPLGVGLLGLAAGYGIGMSNTETVEKTVEVESRVEVTPPACIEALDVAGEGFELGAEGMGASAEAMEAIAAFDVAGIQTATAKIESVTERMNALTPSLTSASGECRAGA